MTDVEAEQFGPNAWLVDEMYEQFRADPSSVSDSWREFFDDYRPLTSPPPPPPAPADGAAAAAPTPAPAPAPSTPAPAPAVEGEPIRGAGAAIVANMEAQPRRPDGHSFRDVPAKLLEVNRRVINGYLGRNGRRQGRASPTSSATRSCGPSPTPSRS